MVDWLIWWPGYIWAKILKQQGATDSVWKAAAEHAAANLLSWKGTKTAALSYFNGFDGRCYDSALNDTVTDWLDAQ